MFLHRENELQIIKETLRSPGTAMMVYGKRRVGKSELILEATKGMRRVYLECLKDTLSGNLAAFMEAIRTAGIELPSYIAFTSFREAFDYLGHAEERCCIIIDEYSYLGELTAQETVDSIFQDLISNHLKNLNLVLSGSAVKVMEGILKEGNPLYGRFERTILLEEFNYLEASSFYPNLSLNDRVCFYGVFGGSLFVNVRLNQNKSLKENITATFLTVGSAVYNYAANMLLTDVASANHARRILALLGNSKKRHGEIMDALDKEHTGIIARPLNSLLEMKVIRKTAPINRKDDSKKTFYEIDDNALRFFYAYVYRRQSELILLGADRFYDIFVAPTISTFIDYRFEAIARSYFSIAIKKGMYPTVERIGTYYFDDPVEKKNGEFDVALGLGEEGYAVIEVKRIGHPLTHQEVQKELDQMVSVREVKIAQKGIVSLFGFEHRNHDALLIDGEDLFFLKP